MAGDQIIDIRGVRLAYRVLGAPATPPMILLHGGSADGSAWAEVAPAFAADRRVYAVDLRGHGASDRTEHYSFELMRDDVVGFLDLLDLRDVTLVGHSMGGVVAYLAAYARPERVSGLVLEETPPPDPMGFTVPDHEIRRHIVGQLNAPDPAWWDAVESIGCPVLTLRGGPASFLPQERIATMAARFPNGSLVTIPVGHHVHRDAPDAFLDAVRAHLGRCTPIR
ncbi:alpha/beta fold hydrolase [Catellatospora aurea]|uniref:Alpha/beta fold hydrolase n=1 Tax=Catellatospora aurea TaxID=1337874 RepID=A0ABW2H3T9_9ACTN